LHTHVTAPGSSGLPTAETIVLLQLERKSKTVMQALHNAQIMLAKGFTTLRNVGDSSDVLYDLRGAINRGLVRGPRIYGVQAQNESEQSPVINIFIL